MTNGERKNRIPNWNRNSKPEVQFEMEKWKSELEFQNWNTNKNQKL